MSYKNLEEYYVKRSYFDEGGLWLVGKAAYGNMGDNSTIDKSSPVQTVAGGTNWKQVAVGNDHLAAIKTDGTLWSWGYNSLGQIGDNSNTNKSSPVQTVAGGTNWKQVAIGIGHTEAIKIDGTLWGWGYNSSGQLGNNNLTDNRSSPVQEVTGSTNWKQVSCGANETAAIKTDGTLWTWGYNLRGSLGDNTIVNRSSPVQTVATGTNWKQVSCGTSFMAAIKTNGELWTWGDGRADNYVPGGQLGNNSTTHKSSPVQTVAGGTNWKKVSCGNDHMVAIKTDGTLWSWGGSYSGCLGTGLAGATSSPVQTVAGGTNWKDVAAGWGHTAATKTDGTLWVWGDASSGKLGINSETSKSSPVQTVCGGTNWKYVSAGRFNTAAIQENKW